MPGAGPVDAAEARRIAAVTGWRRLVVDPVTGTLLVYGARSHPPAEPAGTGAGAPGPSLADDPRWRRIRTDPLEAPNLDHGLSRYVPPPVLRRHVHSRDATCLGPACHHTARGTDLDHVVPFGARAGAVAGTTSATNLASLCRRVHGAKTHGGWGLRQATPGTVDWTSPTGRTYHREVRPLVPGWTGADDP